jgi:sulfite exporter TauE/SafE
VTPIDPAVWVTAFLAGLLGSGHCFGMCGGIAGSLGALAGRSSRSMALPALQFNVGRMLGYAVLGALAGGMVGATALMVLLIGLRFLLDWRGLDVIERGGAGLWRRIQPFAARASQRHDWIGRLGLGICWGFLPCGLVYTVLMTAASAGNAAGGASAMLAFGLGTLPAMLGLTVAAPALSAFLGDRVVRRIVGFGLIVLAIWMLLMLSAAPGGISHH